MRFPMDQLLRATRLTGNGRLAEATRSIQQALGFGVPLAEPAPAAQRAEPTPATAPAEVMDVVFREITVPRPLDGDAAGNEPVLQAARETPEPAAPEAAPEVAVPLPKPASFRQSSFKFGADRYAYRLYTPSSAAGATPALLPMFVMLHGCKQDAADFARGTAMNELAERHKSLVLYPEQLAKANSMRCWNWFEPAHQARDAGEPAMIAALVRQVAQTHGADPERIYAAGLSAGGALAALLGQLYPDVFAAVGVHSGLAPGAAHSVASAFGAMRRGAPAIKSSDTTEMGNLPTIVFHGTSDQTVSPKNGEQLVQAALAAQRGGGQVLKAHHSTQAGEAASGRSAHRTVYTNGEGAAMLESWTVADADHAWAGGNSAGSFTDPKGPSASRAMAEFFLKHTRRR